VRYLISHLIQWGDRHPLHLKSRSSLWQGITGLALTLLLSLALSPGYTQSPSPSPIPSKAPNPAAPLRIATRLIRPDVFKENGQLVGFSVDIGREVLEQLQRQPDLKTYPDIPEVLDAVRSGQSDVGIAAIAITQAREQEFDFSYPVLSSELQIMVLAEAEQTKHSEQQLLQKLLDPSLLRLFGIVALLMLIPVHILWSFERNNPELIDNPAYIPGIFQALWWTLLALVGQAEEMPKGTLTRIMALFWVFVGIVFVTYFTAIITAELTVQEFRSNIQGLSDLQNRPVAVVADLEAVDYLQQQDLQQVIRFTQPEMAYEALLAQKVDAVIAPGPLLLYYAAHSGQGKVQIVGVPFREQFYSIVMPKNSPYRKPINQAILTLKENGTYGKIYRKWFGVVPRG
jgi:polar amino acid transport system substrate-binding protein